MTSQVSASILKFRSPSRAQKGTYYRLYTGAFELE